MPGYTRIPGHTRTPGITCTLGHTCTPGHTCIPGNTCTPGKTHHSNIPPSYPQDNNSTRLLARRIKTTYPWQHESSGGQCRCQWWTQWWDARPGDECSSPGSRSSSSSQTGIPPYPLTSTRQPSLAPQPDHPSSCASPGRWTCCDIWQQFK